MDSLINIEQRLKRVYRDLNMLYEVSCAMRTTLELDNILYIILTGVTSHTGLGYNRAVLFLMNPRLNRLECKMVISPESGEHATKIWEYIEKSKQDLDDLIQGDKITSVVTQSSLYKTLKDFVVPLNENSLLSSAFQRGTPWHIPSSEISHHEQDPFLKLFKSYELVAMPLKVKDKVKGLIVADNLYTPKAITEDDLRIFTMLADQAALAIENSELYEIIVQKSHTDSLTNLWNHGFFQEKLSEELKNAQTTKAPLSLLIIDIDDFKKLNDTYGHQNGDIILQDIARIFRECSRDTDYICRYGGEEFSIILIGTNQIQAFEIAERLRTRIEQANFALAQPGQTLKVTISLGLATFPQDAETKEDLIAKADKAMYIAKFSGKNKTCSAEPDDL